MIPDAITSDHQMDLLSLESRSDLFDRFLAFHRANPRIYQIFEKKALELIAAGHRQYSARRIIEAVRWDHDISTAEIDFKINNNWIPFYSRLFAEAYPEYENFFQRRSRKAAQ